MKNSAESRTNSSSKKALVTEAIAFLEQHYMDRFSLDDMASALYVSKHHLARSFKEVTGITPLQYQHELRCDQATQLLSDPHYTISGVGFRCGFSSASHFSRIFKSCRGCTPSEYRRNALR